MGIFGNKLLLRIFGEQTSSEGLLLHFDKYDKSINHLFPYSCISLINSQLTVLTGPRPWKLCKSILHFVEKPEKMNIPTRWVSKFVLEFYRKGRSRIFNQFNPLIYPGIGNSYEVNAKIEEDIVDLVLNYTSIVYQESQPIDKRKIRVFLLISVSFFQQELVPIMRNIDMNNMQNRTKIAVTHTDFSSSVLSRWDAQLPFVPGSELFNQHLQVATNFDNY